ncbi:hypothetical protein PCANC_18296 [Puccinia coronata f. sp. avenae]|uniref:Tet-like 2OG-Fe(II) oxygenase domain-containing protein n=1 Tax=Puccinia coronata f. sp. avenae TaxID=200324 RepID=A0A2N5UCC7_9BASI|nr:hypothetical protein PCANC_18296 [Puccinia coronata f. sp. avenae]
MARVNAGDDHTKANTSLPQINPSPSSITGQGMLPMDRRSRRNRRARRPRKRPHKNIDRWARAARKAMAPFVRSGSRAPAGLVSTSSRANDDDIDEDDQSNDDNESSPLNNDAFHPCDPVSVSKPKDNKDDKKIHFYYVSLSHQEDPFREEKITSQNTLQLYYHRLSFGTCIIAPTDRAAFCKAKWISFDSMTPGELNGWEKLVCHLLERTEYVNPVKGNGAQNGGQMWADGWRKSSDPGQSVGRFCSMPKMKKAIERAKYNPVFKAAGIQEASDFISCQLQNFAPGVFDSCRQLLINGNYPSMAHMEYPAPYTANNFASFLTFTMYNFFNQPHQDRDVNLWTFVIWILIFRPTTRAEDDPILADQGFDMMGGQFTFRDFQVYLDLEEFRGVTFCHLHHWI